MTFHGPIRSEDEYGRAWRKLARAEGHAPGAWQKKPTGLPTETGDASAIRRQVFDHITANPGITASDLRAYFRKGTRRMGHMVAVLAQFGMVRVEVTCKGRTNITRYWPTSGADPTVHLQRNGRAKQVAE